MIIFRTVFLLCLIIVLILGAVLCRKREKISSESTVPLWRARTKLVVNHELRAGDLVSVVPWIRSSSSLAGRQIGRYLQTTKESSQNISADEIGDVPVLPAAASFVSFVYSTKDTLLPIETFEPGMKAMICIVEQKKTDEVSKANCSEEYEIAATKRSPSATEPGWIMLKIPKSSGEKIARFSTASSRVVLVSK